MIDSLNLFSIFLSITGAMTSVSMFFLVVWQGLRRPINFSIAVYLMTVFVWVFSNSFAQATPLIGFDPTLLIYTNGSAIIFAGVVLLTFIFIYRGFFTEPRYWWAKYICGVLGVYTVVLVVLTFNGLTIIDTDVLPSGDLLFRISTVGRITFPFAYLLYPISLIVFVRTATSPYWESPVFWGLTAVTLGVFIIAIPGLTRTFPGPSIGASISIFFFTYFILQESLFSPLQVLNTQLEETNKQLATANRQAKQSEAYLRSVMENTSDLIWSINQYHRLVMMNSTGQAFFELLFERQLQEGDLFYQYMSHEQEDQWRTLFGYAFEGRRFSVERRYHFENLASHFDLEISFNPAFDRRNQVVSVSVFARDITRYKETERELKQQALTFDTISDSIILAGLDWKITDCNPATVQILGYTKEELVGQPVSFFFGRDDGKLLLDDVFVDLTRRGRWFGDVPFVRKSGLNGVAEAIILPIRDDESQALSSILVVSRDITERKSQEVQLQQAKNAAEAANQAKSAFLASMSHELRTPLNAIIGYGEILYEDVAEQDDHSMTLDLYRIVKAGRHLLSIVNSILDLSKIEAGRVQLEIDTIGVGELVDSVVSSVRPMIESNNNQLVVDIPPDIPPVHTDPLKLRQVLINLLGNAAKFTSNGTISIKSYTESNLGERWFVFEVHDTGVGIPQDKLESIFEAFIQADNSTTRKYQGTGLGLTICKRYVDLMGGTIGAVSDADKGSIFTVRLPEYISAMFAPPREDLMSDSDITAVNETRSRNVWNADGSAVLVVDDNAATRSTLTRWLYDSGYRVFTTAHGRGALKNALNQSPHSIILDLILPDMSSWDVFFRLKQQEATKDIQIIFSVYLEDLQQGFAFEAHAGLFKTANLEDVSAVFRRLVGRFGRPTSSDDPLFDICLFDEDENIADLFQQWTVDNGGTVSRFKSRSELLTALSQPFKQNLVVIDLDIFSETAFELIACLQQADHPVALLLTSSQDSFTDGTQRLSTKSTMTMINAGLYGKTRWLRLLTDDLLLEKPRHRVPTQSSMGL